MRFQCHQRDYSSFSSSESYCFQCWYRHFHCIFHHWLLLSWRCALEREDGGLTSTPQQQLSPTGGSLQQWRAASPSVAHPSTVWRCSLRRGTRASCCPNQMEEEEAAHCTACTVWVLNQFGWSDPQHKVPGGLFRQMGCAHLRCPALWEKCLENCWVPELFVLLRPFVARPLRWLTEQRVIWGLVLKEAFLFLLPTLLISGFPSSRGDPCSVPLSPFLWINGNLFLCTQATSPGIHMLPLKWSRLSGAARHWLQSVRIVFGFDGRDTSSRISFVFELLLKLRASFVLLKVTSRKNSIGLCVAKHWFHSYVSSLSTAVTERNCNKCFSINAQQCILLWTSWNP